MEEFQISISGLGSWVCGLRIFRRRAFPFAVSYKTARAIVNRVKRSGSIPDEAVILFRRNRRLSRGPAGCVCAGLEKAFCQRIVPGLLVREALMGFAEERAEVGEEIERQVAFCQKAFCSPFTQLRRHPSTSLRGRPGGSAKV